MPYQVIRTRPDGAEDVLASCKNEIDALEPLVYHAGRDQHDRQISAGVHPFADRAAAEDVAQQVVLHDKSVMVWTNTAGALPYHSVQAISDLDGQIAVTRYRIQKS